MVLFVKNLTANGKSLATLIISILFLTACSTGQQYHNTSHSTVASTNELYHPANSTFAIAWNAMQWKASMMNDYDRKQQENAVFFALNNLKTGEITRWYNGNTGARGAVKGSMSYPQGSGYCRVLMSQIMYNNKIRDFSETACINSTDNTWRFVR